MLLRWRAKGIRSLPSGRERLLGCVYRSAHRRDVYEQRKPGGAH